MTSLTSNILKRLTFSPGTASDEFRVQFRHPSDVFSVLLLLGGDVVARALAQLAGGFLTPVAFSFGWVAYAVAALVSAVGENKLMPPSDVACKVINAENGYVRDNSAWIIGRIVRDYDDWMDPKIYIKTVEVRQAVRKHQEKEWEEEDREERGAFPNVTLAGLTVAVYRLTAEKTQGRPDHDLVYVSGFIVIILQLGVAAIPLGLFGDWGIMMVTIAGTFLALLSGTLPQWKKEKWACRHAKKDFILTKGNGSQHAILILGATGGLDLEDLASSQLLTDNALGNSTRVWITVLATLWVLLLITAAGLVENTWFLLAVGGIGILQNVIVAGVPRDPGAFGIHLDFVDVIATRKVMDTLFQLEEKYPSAGRSMLDTFFPGEIFDEEEKKWANLKVKAKAFKKARKDAEKAAKEARKAARRKKAVGQ